MVPQFPLAEPALALMTGIYVGELGGATTAQRYTVWTISPIILTLSHFTADATITAANNDLLCLLIYSRAYILQYLTPSLA